MMGASVIAHEAVVSRWRGRYFRALPPLLEDLDDRQDALGQTQLLRELAALRASQAITEEEYKSKKAEILRRL
jgi:hypothetical protein